MSFKLTLLNFRTKDEDGGQTIRSEVFCEYVFVNIHDTKQWVTIHNKNPNYFL